MLARSPAAGIVLAALCSSACATRALRPEPPAQHAAASKTEPVADDAEAAFKVAHYESAVEERARLTTRQLELEQALARADAGKRTQLEAERMLRFREDERALPRAERESARGQAIDWLYERAALTLAAAIALGLPSEQSAPVEQAIAQKGQPLRERARLAGAYAVLAEAERLLRAQRETLNGAKTPPAPTDP